MPVTCTCIVSTLSLRAIPHRIAREPDCQGVVKTGLTEPVVQGYEEQHS